MISPFLHLLYEASASGSAEAWVGVYDHLAKLLGSGPGFMGIYSASADRFHYVATTFRPESRGVYDDFFMHIDPIRARIVRLGEDGEFIRTRDLPDNDFLETEFYKQFLKNEGIYEVFYTVLFAVPGFTGGIGLTRPKNRATFTAEQKRIFAELLPHLKRAFRSYYEMTEARRSRQCMQETLSHTPRSIFFVDSTGKVGYCNLGGSRLLERADGLATDRHGIMFAHESQDNQKFRSVLKNITGRDRDPAARPEIVTINRPSGARPLQVLITPFMETKKDGYESECLALVVVYDPEQTVETDERVLRQMYGLTRAEARLAALLAGGNSLSTAAELLSIQHDTVRTHLKRIFSKTRTNRQSDLVTLILNSPAALRNL